ncbi:unnamed protein product [Cuscuta campestris]|uniref:DUF1985 domain-containing protein n=1 Tax=Cuscuta campestris TaxID=132261 RepID=A0A484LV86_9ASTE|nr:unnamed protein product [Cuscuta campestris]
MWFVVKGVPVMYSLREFSLIRGLYCSHLNAGFENSKELSSAKNDSIRAHFPSAKKGKKSAAVTYKMVVQRFLDICKGLDREKKKEGQEMDVVKMETLLFVVVVLLGPADRDKSAIPYWILGMSAQWTAVLARPRICFWGEIPIKKKITLTEMDAYVGDVQALQSILVPDKFEDTAEWYLNFYPLETTTHPELDALVAKLEGRGEVHIPVERKRKARNVPSPTRDNSVECNEHIFSPQASQRSQSLRESPFRVSHSNIPTPSSPTPHPTKPSSNSFQELFDRMSKKIDDIAEEQRKRFEVPETTIMDDCEETEARNPSPDDKDSPGPGILQILGEINQEHENPPSTLSNSVLCLENRMAESTHETIGTEVAASMKPLQEMVESSHEVNETDDAASMKPLQDKVVSPQKELGDEAEIIDALVYGKRLKKKSASSKSPYTADRKKKKKADELLSKPLTKGDLLEFKSFIVEAIKTDRLVQCYLEQHKEHEEFVKTWWTNLTTPGLWVADTHLSEYLYVLRRRLCNGVGDSVIAPFEFTTYVNSFACDPQWPVLSRPIEKIVDARMHSSSSCAAAEGCVI